MSWSVKQDVSGGDGVFWSQNLLQSGTAETLKPPFMRRQQPQQQSELLKCPRCGSTNTKFCYYNNYNKSQPRYFCKACKRHWTKGGTLRNVPVGGGRKNKRPKNSNSATITPTISAAAAVTPAAPQHQDGANFPLTSTINLDQKIMSNILYQALFHSSSPIIEDTNESIKTIPGDTSMGKNGTTNTTVLNESPLQNEITELPFSSSSTVEANSCLILNSYQSLKVTEDYPGNLDSAEESTITTVDIPSTSNMQWLGAEISNSMDHLSNYWNWNDMEELASPDFNVSWDTEIKVETNFQGS